MWATEEAPRGQLGCAVCGKRPPPRALDQGKGGSGWSLTESSLPSSGYFWKIKCPHPSSFHLGLFGATKSQEMAL